MFRHLTLSTALALVLAGPLAAQDATATDETATDETPTDDAATGETATGETATEETATGETDAGAATETTDGAATDGGGAPSINDLSMGTPEGAQADGPGAPYVREEFGDWSLRCLRVEEGAEPCTLYQLLLDEDDNPVAEIALFPLPEGSEAVAGANFVAPMETYLPAGLRLTVDSGETLTYPFTFCSQRGFSPLLSSGCLARIGFDQAMVDRFKRGAAAQIVIVPALAPDQQVVLDVSLSGFTAGFDAQSANAPAQ
ncbi:invasion associated locus B family protein [Wenxinia marina]|uniref:Invasion protein B, involved in pathogenesis n=1 Tax=Wenxinia marina DSM 24838 TaxID=1123501 RepID=A0A0D0QCS5_9RHOB|nr:invasion associated locus B family protein [Wenxinia marina]KIQ68753.1 Invasion protein B, involved in pathogenesis [Wenxinia marina DSM 24838]GGL65431.1 hypothetical protein GCM10011392_20170 [Wenxinia marina]